MKLIVLQNKLRFKHVQSFKFMERLLIKGKSVEPLISVDFEKNTQQNILIHAAHCLLLYFDAIFKF